MKKNYKLNTKQAEGSSKNNDFPEKWSRKNTEKNKDKNRFFEKSHEIHNSATLTKKRENFQVAKSGFKKYHYNRLYRNKSGLQGNTLNKYMPTNYLIMIKFL